MDDAAVIEELRAAAAPFATAPPPSPSAVELVYGPLFRALMSPDSDDGPYPLALEFVYEGYLTHYRVSRLLGPDADLHTRLLAGDHFDASGLRLVARTGDLDAVGLLTRLMAVCSWLRAEDAPTGYDDDLWALCVAGVASSASGGNALAALRVFDEVRSLILRGREQRLPDVVRRGAATVWLRDPGPLHAALGLCEEEPGLRGPPDEVDLREAADDTAPTGDRTGAACEGTA